MKFGELEYGKCFKPADPLYGTTVIVNKVLLKTRPFLRILNKELEVTEVNAICIADGGTAFLKDNSEVVYVECHFGSIIKDN